MKNAIKVLMVSVAAITLLSACAEAPNKELAAAKGAVDAVVSEGAEQYTPNELKAVNNKLDEALTEIQAQDKLFFKNYSLAVYTLDQVKSDAEALKGKVSQRKEELKTAATQALVDAQAALAEAKAQLEAAPVGKGSMADIEAMKSDVAGLETELTSVQPQIEAGDFSSATEKAQAISARALTINSDIAQAQQKVAAVKK